MAAAQPDGPESPRRAGLDAAIAEYNALRAEILARSTSQSAFVGAGLTAIGVIAGYATTGAGNSTILLAIPLVSSVVILIYAGLAAGNRALGRYIRSELWPYIQDRSGSPVPCWELSVYTYRRSGRFGASPGLPGISVGLLFYVCGLVGALAAGDVPLLVNLGAAIVVTVAGVAGLVLAVRAVRTE